MLAKSSIGIQQLTFGEIQQLDVPKEARLTFEIDWYDQLVDGVYFVWQELNLDEDEEKRLYEKLKVKYDSA